MSFAATCESKRAWRAGLSTAGRRAAEESRAAHSDVSEASYPSAESAAHSATSQTRQLAKPCTMPNEAAAFKHAASTGM